MCVARAQRAKSHAGGWQVRRPTGPMGRAPAQRSPPRAARAPSAAAVQEVQWRWRLRRQQQPAGEREPHPSAHPPTSTAGWATRSLPAESAPPFEADARSLVDAIESKEQAWSARFLGPSLSRMYGAKVSFAPPEACDETEQGAGHTRRQHELFSSAQRRNIGRNTRALTLPSIHHPGIHVPPEANVQGRTLPSCG